MNTTQKAILDAAVGQFADKGFDGASLREILRDARVNAASAHYHFGSKEAVYEAVVRSFLTPLCDERLASLRGINVNLGGKPRLDTLIRNYVGPHLRLCAKPEAHAYVRLLARFITERHALTAQIYTELLEPVRSQYLTALRQAVPHLSFDQVKRLFGFAVILMATAPLDVSYEALSGRDPWPSNPEDLIDQIVAYVAAGFWQAETEACTKGSRVA